MYWSSGYQLGKLVGVSGSTSMRFGDAEAPVAAGELADGVGAGGAGAGADADADADAVGEQCLVAANVEAAEKVYDLVAGDEDDAA